MGTLTNESELIDSIRAGVSSAIRGGSTNREEMTPVTAAELASKVRRDAWVERWPGEDGDPATIEVHGEVWREAMQESLDRFGYVRIPARSDPYYLDGPLVLASGAAIEADRDAVIRLVPATNTCMVRNRSVFASPEHPAHFRPDADSDITIHGGIWTTLATAQPESNGNIRGRADRDDSVPGAHGVILLHNVRRASLRDLEIRQSRPFGIHLGSAEDVSIDTIRYVEHRRDGIHLDGPVRRVIIRDIEGDTGDDVVALNAWDWHQYSTTFGPISYVLVDGVTCTRPDSHASIRLLPGHKSYADGSVVACPVEHCVVRNLSGIRNVKIYDQPNLEAGGAADRSARTGEVRDVHLTDISLQAEEIGIDPDRTFLFSGVVEVAANASGLSIRRVTIESATGELPEHYALLSVGPNSATWRPDRDDPSTWVELFSPDDDCTVEDLVVDDVRLVGPSGKSERDSRDRLLDPRKIVRIIEQRPNPDYPESVPKGGTGRGRIVGWTVRPGADAAS